MIATVVSEFNTKVIDGLLKGCKQALSENGLVGDKILIERVPGAFELPAKAKQLASKDGVKAVITLGAVIKGETDHYHYISEAVSHGMMQVTLESEIPVLFGVLTCQNAELAYARSGDDMTKNKGYEVGKAVVQMLS